MRGPTQRSVAASDRSSTPGLPLTKRSGALLIGALAIAAALFAAGRWLDLAGLYRVILTWARSLGPWGWVLFVALYMAATVLLMPTILLNLGAGAVYGVLGGTALALLGASVGAAAAFWISRVLARNWVRRCLERHPVFGALDEIVARNGWKVVALMRLTPAVPFVVKNYAFGATRVSGRDYILATAVGMIPGIALNAYLGSLAVNLAMLGTDLLWRGGWGGLLYGMAFVTTLAVTLYLSRLARGALRQVVAAGAPTRPPGNSC